MKFQFPEDFVPTEEQLELQFSVNEWKIIQKALIQFALHDLSITPARMDKQIRDELANTKLQQNMEKLEKMIDPDLKKTLEDWNESQWTNSRGAGRSNQSTRGVQATPWGFGISPSTNPKI